MPYMTEIDPLNERDPTTEVTAERIKMEEEERTKRIRVKNRRKLYLDRHPSYFTASDLELAGM